MQNNQQLFKKEPMKKELTKQNRQELLHILRKRFEENMTRHKNMEWVKLQARLEANSEKLWPLNEMEATGGEPDVVDLDKKTSEYIFIDCSKESPAGRRNLCYDREALNARKANKPCNSAMDVATQMGVTLLTEDQYRKYHPLVNFDAKTSSWVMTPSEIRKLGGAIFCDFRFGRVFTCHNGAESYYGGRGFRGMLIV